MHSTDPSHYPLGTPVLATAEYHSVYTHGVIHLPAVFTAAAGPRGPAWVGVRIGGDGAGGGSIGRLVSVEEVYVVPAYIPGTQAGMPLDEVQALPLGSHIMWGRGRYVRTGWTRRRPHKYMITVSAGDWRYIDGLPGPSHNQIRAVDYEDVGGARLVWRAPELDMQVIEALRPQADDAVAAVRRDGDTALTAHGQSAVSLAGQQIAVVRQVIDAAARQAFSRGAEIRDSLRLARTPTAPAEAADAWASYVAQCPPELTYAVTGVQASSEARHWAKTADCPFAGCRDSWAGMREEHAARA